MRVKQITAALETYALMISSLAPELIIITSKLMMLVAIDVAQRWPQFCTC